MLNKETVKRKGKHHMGVRNCIRERIILQLRDVGSFFMNKPLQALLRYLLFIKLLSVFAAGGFFFRKKQKNLKFKKISDLEQLKRGRKRFYKFGLTVISIRYMIYCQIHHVNASDTFFIISREHIMTGKLNLFY